MSLTKHAAERLDERGIPSADLELLLAAGDLERKQVRHCRSIQLSRRAAQRLIRAGIARARVDRLRRLTVITGGDGAIVTIYRGSPPRNEGHHRRNWK